ncbi:hypothetical protein Tco_0911384 [Tanacetum coccineum]|uniref:Uncharacterized protein n=1 Tax=Tanacetum coccineum TaxID=301880 RepID=A0ABQ5D1W0_9ASTR
METKDTLSSCSYSDEQDMQQMLKQAKILKGGCVNGLSALKSNFTRKLEQGITKSEFERAFSHIFDEDVDTFTRMFSQNMDTLEQQLTKETILESNCQNAFRIQECTVQEVKALDAISEDKAKKSCMVSFRKLHSHLKHLSHDNLKGTQIESGFKRAFAALFESKEQDTSSRSGNDAHADDADIRPIYDEEPMVEVQTTAEINIFATGQQHTEQPKFNNEGKVDQNAEQCHDTCPLPVKLTDNQTTKLLNQSLESENIRLKKTVAQFQKDFLRMEAHCVNLELKYQNQALKEGQHGQFLKVTSNEAKVKHDIDVIETINIELEHKVAKLLKENETLKKHYKEIPGFASQVDVNNDLSKPVTTYYLPKEREVSSAKPHYMIAHGSSRYNSNDMVHNHYLEEAKKQTQEIGRNSKTSVIPSARSQSTTNGSKPKHRFNNQKSRNFPASKNSCVTTKTVPIAEHSRNFRNFSDSKHFVCSTCQKCVVNANHDSCVTKFLNEVNSCAKVPSNKTTKRYKLVEQTSFAKKPERYIPKGHRWVTTRKIFNSSTTKVDSEPPNGSNENITNPYECEQTLDVSAGTMFLNMDQLQKQLDNNEFQEIGSMASFKVLETQFQMFIKSKIYLNDEYIVMTRNYFLQYTQLDIPEFRETLVQFMEYVKKSIDERALHKREHDRRVNERQTQTTMEKVDTSKELDASSVIIESNGTESQTMIQAAI